MGGEWVETGEWIDVRSPYSGDVVGRVPRAGAAEARRAIDAAERSHGRSAPCAQARRDPRPRRRLSRQAARRGRADDLGRGRQADEGSPHRGRKRAMSTYTFAAVEARKLAGEVVPMDASQAGDGKLAFTLRRPDRRRRRDLAVQLPAQPRRAQDRARARRGLRRRAEACVADAAVGAAPRRARARGGLACRAGSTSSSGPAAEIGDVLVHDERVKLITFTGSSDVGWKLRERAARKKVGARARQRDARDRRGRCRRRRGRVEARRQRVRLRGPELHLRAADLRAAARRTTPSSNASSPTSRR